MFKLYVQTFNRGQHNWTFSMIYNMTFLKVLDVKVVPSPLPHRIFFANLDDSDHVSKQAYKAYSRD